MLGMIPQRRSQTGRATLQNWFTPTIVQPHLPTDVTLGLYQYYIILYTGLTHKETHQRAHKMGSEEG